MARVFGGIQEKAQLLLLQGRELKEARPELFLKQVARA